MTNLAAHKGSLFTTVTPGDHACTHLAEDNSLLILFPTTWRIYSPFVLPDLRLQRIPGGEGRGSRAQRLPAQPQEESCRQLEAVRAAGLCANNRRSGRACCELPHPVPNQSLPAHPRVSSTRDAAPPAGTPPTCGAIPTSAAHLTASTAPTYDDPGVGAPAHSRTPPAPAPFPAPSHAPAPAAPPVRSGPARHRPLALGRGGAAVPTPAGAGRVHIAYCAPGLAAPLDLLAMDTDDSQAPKGSLRKFLEHLSGAGKAVGVLTRGEDAQDAWKGADGGFPPVSGPRTAQGWSGNGPPPSVPVTFPSPLSARGGTGAACWGAVSAAPPAASAYVMPGPSSP
ncbi:uncharacterized protein [Chlorocebus sabaeus]|uniref:uncharacterized protein n=1 Tax=Chlorocebus sabaeus TaxID=60711 RepID=UPI003BFA1640